MLVANARVDVTIDHVCRDFTKGRNWKGEEENASNGTGIEILRALSKIS